MSQICYKIMEALALKRSHIRALAKELGTNQTTIARKVKELQAGNILDFSQEGKNKVFFIKRSLEARQYSYIVEHSKLLEAIRKYPRLRQITEIIQKDSRIKLAILFGSYAKMSAGKESDMDIYIRTMDRSLKRELESVDSLLSIKIGEFDRETPLAKEIEKNHVVIKGVEEYGKLLA
ncbi:MAG: nucleotidyltransferase domain-containing protein [Candidatus Woesearchaeota archaeon]